MHDEQEKIQARSALLAEGYTEVFVIEERKCQLLLSSREGSIRAFWMS